MRKWMIFLIIILSLGFVLSMGYYIYKLPQNNRNIEEAKIESQDNEPEEIKLSSESSVYYSENDILQTSGMEEKVSPDATLIIKKFYKECGHTTKDYAAIPEEMVNKTEQEVREMYKNWTLQGFSPKEIVLYKKMDGICNEHYILKQLDGVIAIYVLNDKQEEILQEKTGIATQYLPEKDLTNLEEGIRVNGREELNSLIEDYE